MSSAQYHYAMQFKLSKIISCWGFREVLGVDQNVNTDDRKKICSNKAHASPNERD